MAANAISGAHGRDISAAEAAWSSHPAVALGTPTNPVTFDDVLSAMNPLQYLPVVGTIYRVLTGDDANPGLRTAISMVSGLLLGGPIGLLTNIGGALAEHFFPFEQMARSAITGGSTRPAPVATASASPEAATVSATKSPAATPAPVTAPTAARAVPATALAAYDRVDAVAGPLFGVGRSG